MRGRRLGCFVIGVRTRCYVFHVRRLSSVMWSSRSWDGSTSCRSEIAEIGGKCTRVAWDPSLVGEPAVASLLADAVL